MQIGEVIRNHRKNRNMTQEQMAERLGVTAPAVNKWENGNSMPDILLLAPIARLLHISLDTLLSFRENLTDEEIQSLLMEAEERLLKDTYEEAFRWAKKQMQEYPDCGQLMLQMAGIFDGWRLMKNIPDSEQPEQADSCIRECYAHALVCSDEKSRCQAAQLLYSYYFRKGQYEKAQECLSYFSGQNPEKKRMQADIDRETGRTAEACLAYEELLFHDYQEASVLLHSLYKTAASDGNMAKARSLIQKQLALADIFEMGEYHKAVYRLELAEAEKDADMAVNAMEAMLAAADQINSYTKSQLYEHMPFHEIRKEYIEGVKDNLRGCLRDEEAYAFLKDDKRWQQLAQGIYAEG